MTKLGIWKLMTHHHQQHALLRQQVTDCDDAEVCKNPPKKCKRPSEVDRSPEECSSPFATTDAYAAASTKKKEKQVCFSAVEVRIYEVVLGDNPDLSFPLSLGWRYNTQETQDLETYECHQLPNRKNQQRIEERVHVGELLGSISPFACHPLIPRTLRPLSLHERRMALRAQGHSEQSLRQAERRRRVELSLQWASGQCPKSEVFPYSRRFFLNYVL